MVLGLGDFELNRPGFGLRWFKALGFRALVFAYQSLEFWGFCAFPMH